MNQYPPGHPNPEFVYNRYIILQHRETLVIQAVTGPWYFWDPELQIYYDIFEEMYQKEYNIYLWGSTRAKPPEGATTRPKAVRSFLRDRWGAPAAQALSRAGVFPWWNIGNY
jgi:hypothetical protein